MRWPYLLMFIILLVIVAASIVYYVYVYDKKQVNQVIMSKTLSLTSSVFANNGMIPEKYTCDGSNFSPPLSIAGVPPEAKSLTLIMDDPDAPAPPVGGWDHWLIYNLPAGTTELGEGEPPPGVLGQGTAGEMNYQGPCPPSGVHRYFFKLYALDSELPLPPGATKTELEEAMIGHIIDQAEFVGRYGR